MFRQEIPRPNYLVDLGPVYRICYRKRVRELGQVHSPRYCHDFGEHWPSEALDRLAPVLARDENGNAHLIPQRVVDTEGKVRDATFITDHGYEDLPMSKIRSIPGYTSVRANPEPSRGAASASGSLAETKPGGRNTLPRSAGSQFYSYAGPNSGGGYTQVRVRKIGPVGVMARHVVAGVLGAFVAPVFNRFVLSGTRLSPFYKGLVVLGTTALAGVATGFKYPRLGAGVLLGGFAVAGTHMLDAGAARLAEATAMTGPLPGSTVAPAPAATQPAPAPQVQAPVAPSGASWVPTPMFQPLTFPR